MPSEPSNPSRHVREWQTRHAGRLTLRFLPHTVVAQEIDELTDRYADALVAIADALDVTSDMLPTVTVYLSDLPSPDGSHTLPESTGSTSDGLAIWAVHTAELPCAAPEVELARLLLAHHYGSPPPSARFWDEGFVGYLSTRSGRGPGDADVAVRCREHLADGLLPPLSELVATAGERMLAVAADAARCFATYLIDRHGLARYRLLLETIRTDRNAFERVYGSPLVLVDRDWRRSLDATAGGPGQPSPWGTVRLLLPLARPYWQPGLGILVYVLIGIIFSLALPLAFRFLIDNILGRRPLQEPIPFVGPAGHVVGAGREQLEALTGLMVVLGILYILNAAARLRMAIQLNSLGESLVLDLRRQLLEVTARLPASFFARTTTADVNQRILYDTTSIQQVVTGALVPLIGGVLSATLYAAVLFALEPRLAFVALLGLPLLGLIYHLRRHNLRAAARERVRRVSDLSASVTELAATQVLVKLYAAAPYVLSRLGRRLEAHRQLNVAYARESSLLGQAALLIIHLIQVAVLVVGGYLVVSSGGRDLAPGGLAAFYVLLSQLFGPVGQIAAARQSLTDASANLDRISELLAESTEQEPPDGAELGPLRDSLRLDRVSFAYTADGPAVLQRLSLTIPAGATVAFVGPTGAGKSSLVQLLPRLYDPTRGIITWDGIDSRRATLGSLRRQIGLVQQDPVLISGTVYENIRFGLEGAGGADVERAAQQARAHDFIIGLPQGYDTIVGERGVGLSGGQRQRVTLARALLRNPSVLILDEATSGLDATTQRALQERLRTEAGGRTLIKIAHRLETIVDADIIFVLDGGRLVEQGRHADLMAKDGLYARLFEDQIGALTAAGQTTSRQAARWLARLAPFTALSSGALDNLAAAMVRTERKAGETIYRQGSVADELYVVGQGRVEMLTTDADGRQRIANTLGPGTILGFSALSRGRPRATTARASTDVVLFRLSRSAFESTVRELHWPPTPSSNPVSSGSAHSGDGGGGVDRMVRG